MPQRGRRDYIKFVPQPQAPDVFVLSENISVTDDEGA